VVAKKSLRRWTNAELERVREVEMIAWVFGLGWRAAGADLWRGGGQGFERVRLWSVSEV